MREREAQFSAVIPWVSGSCQFDLARTFFAAAISTNQGCAARCAPLAV